MPNRFPPIPLRPARMPNAPTAPTVEDRRGEVERFETLTGRVHRIQGFFKLTGAGEATMPVAFPVWFMEVPIFHFGAEVSEETTVNSGTFPTISAVVLKWNKTTDTDQTGTPYWNGALIGAVSTGSENQVLLVHWTFEGKALRNPRIAGTESTTTDTTI